MEVNEKLEIILSNLGFIKQSECYIYFLYDGDDVVYIGQATCLRTRLKSHVKDKTFDRVSFEYCKLSDVLEKESSYINQYRPKYNKKDNVEYGREKPLNQKNKEASLKLSLIVRNASASKGYTGVMKLADAVRDKTGLSTERTRKLWKGLFEVKIGDYITVMGFLEDDIIIPFTGDGCK